MNNIKKFRNALNLTQEMLAQKLDISQQSIARWEKGTAEPNAKALRDMSLIFGTSIDEILNVNNLENSKPRSNICHIFSGGEFDGFWGHIGLEYKGKNSCFWYPIDLREKTRIQDNIDDSDVKFVTFESLDNHLIIFNKTNVFKISFVDDGADPTKDWDCPKDYQGLSFEIYKSASKLSDISLGKDDLILLKNYLGRKLLNFTVDEIEAETNEPHINEISREIDDSEDTSLTYLSQVINYFVDNKLYKEKKFFEKFVLTKVGTNKFKTDKLHLFETDISKLVLTIEGGLYNEFIYIDNSEVGHEFYYNINDILYIDIPLVKYVDATNQILHELEE